MLLSVENLSSVYRIPLGDVLAVDGVDLRLKAGESLGLIGESGCGKTTVLKSILGLLDPNGGIVGGRIWFEAEDLTQMNKSAFRSILWDKISFIPQSSMNSLNPVYRISTQIMEAVRAHRSAVDQNRVDYHSRITKLFEMVGLEPSRMDDYPHQFSGGMAQRAVIAMALILDPVLVIADEPTSALDVVVQRQILDIFRDLKKKCSLFLVTHDVSVVSQVCDVIYVMYAGRIIESGRVKDVLNEPFHPYTIGLVTVLNDMEKAAYITPISTPGAHPVLTSSYEGCSFRERCPFSMKRCSRKQPEIISPDMTDHRVACHRSIEANNLREKARDPRTWSSLRLLKS